MHHESLARVFRRIVLLSLPGSAIAVGTACSGTVRDSSGTNVPGAGGSTAESGGATNATGGATNATGGATNATGGATNATGGATNATGGATNATGGATNATGGATNATGGVVGSGGTVPGLGSGGTATNDAGTAVDSCGDPLPPPNQRPLCTSSCMPLDGITLRSDASMPIYSRTECQTLCGSGNWISCGPVTVHGKQMLRCSHDCTGRRPPGLLPWLAAAGPALGAHFAEMAQLEAASVEAFRLLRDELAHHRAPRALIRAAERAIRDEIRHTRLTLALARRHGGEFRPPVVEKMSLRTLEAIAMDNAVEGCVRETFGALVATYQSRAAIDPSIRAVMKRIARDETRHAALAHDVDGWVQGRLDRAARMRVDAARRAATEVLLAREDELGFAERRALGLPTRSEERDLLQAMTAAIAA